jgi:type II secretion system protein I
MTTANPSVRRGVSPGGFTLIEVLTALAILAVVLSVAIPGIGLATKLAGLTRQRDIASNLAETELNELLATGNWDNGASGGQFSSHPNYSWQAATQSISEPDLPDVGLTQLNVTVEWRSLGHKHHVTMTTLIYTSPPSTTDGATTGALQ